MTHPSPITEDDLNAYLDDLLSAETRARVEAALAAQPALAQQLADLQRVFDHLDQLKSAPLPQPTHNLAPEIMRAIQAPQVHASSAPSTLSGRVLVIALLLQSVVALLAVILLLPMVGRQFAIGGILNIDINIAHWPAWAWVTTGLPNLLALPIVPWPSAQLFDTLPLWGVCFSLIGVLWLIGNGLLLAPKRTSKYGDRHD